MKLTNTENGRIRIAGKADFEAMFRDHYSTLCAYANHFLKDPDASEEVVQEVMFRIWVNRETLEFTSSLKSYLFRAVRNGSLNVLKHMNIREEYQAAVERDRDPVRFPAEEPMVMSELEGRIRRAIDGLPMERRRIFLMSRYDGLTYREIADKLGLSVKTVENQMGKALRTLREELADYLPVLLLFLLIFRN